MRTNIISFVMASENREKIVKTIFDYPKRQWSCTFLEELTKISHSTVFRTLNGLVNYGILKSVKVNKRDIIYELVDSPLSKELINIINIEKTTIQKITKFFVNKIKNDINSAILFGSSVNENLKPGSDIDILIVLSSHSEILEKKIYDIAAEISSEFNKTISTTIVDLKELNNNTQFIKSVKDKMEMIYGKNPFSAS